jgi:hypothetical protein
MNSYRALKAKEVELALAALQERLEQCPRANGQHEIVLERLEALLAALAQELLIFTPVIHDVAFRSLLDKTLNRVSIYLSLVEMQYLRGLATPSKEELYLRSILLNCAKRLGLDWIEDMAVQGSGALAIYPELGNSLAIPAFHVPTGLLDSFLSLPGVYHEFGHSVFARFPLLLDAMKQVVRVYFEELIRQLGPMQPAIRDAQIKRFQDAETFWTDRCLEELFCDLFAQYIGGCANVVSMIDLSMAKGYPTYDMGSSDYPPDAARVCVCALALTADQAAEASTKHLLEEWKEYSQRFSDSQFYRDACAENLLKQLGRMVFAEILSAMPKLKKNETPPPDLKVAFATEPQVSFEDAIQRGCTVLAWNRDNFESWWEDIQTRLI